MTPTLAILLTSTLGALVGTTPGAGIVLYLAARAWGFSGWGLGVRGPVERVMK